METPVLRRSGRLRVAIVMNTYEDGLEAGGFVHLFQSAKRWNDFDLTVFGPAQARERVARELPNALFAAIPSLRANARSRALVYGLRTLAAAIYLPATLRRFDAICALSQSLPDILPAVLAAPHRTIAQIHHLQPPPWKRSGSLLGNAFAYVNECLGVSLIRHWVSDVIVVTRIIEPQLRLPPRTRTWCSGNGAWTVPLDGYALDAAQRSGAVYVGRIHPAKGIDDLVQAWELVAERRPDATLTLVGTGDDAYVQALKARIDRAGLGGSIRFTGFVSEQEKAQKVGAARVFVTASPEEGWGISVAEAMALATPCVTYDLPAFREVFPRGRVGVRVGDVAALAEAVTALLQDEAHWRMLSEQACKVAGAFSWDSVARVEEEAILRVAQRF